MKTVPPARQGEFASLLRAANKAISNGVVDVTHHDRRRYWKHWKSFCRLYHLDPGLSGLQYSQQVQLLCAFAASV